MSSLGSLHCVNDRTVFHIEQWPFIDYLYYSFIALCHVFIQCKNIRFLHVTQNRTYTHFRISWFWPELWAEIVPSQIFGRKSNRSNPLKIQIDKKTVPFLVSLSFLHIDHKNGTLFACMLKRRALDDSWNGKNRQRCLHTSCASRTNRNCNRSSPN